MGRRRACALPFVAGQDAELDVIEVIEPSPSHEDDSSRLGVYIGSIGRLQKST